MTKRTGRDQLEQEILRLAGSCHKTAEKVGAIQDRHRRWMIEHPADEGMRGWGQMLAMLRGVSAPGIGCG